MNIPPQTGIQKQRAAWWAENYKPGMPRDEVFRLIEEAITLFPKTNAERELKTRDLEAMPEFVL